MIFLMNPSADNADIKKMIVQKIDAPITQIVFFVVKPKPRIMPVPASHHFQGSVKSIKKGTHAAIRVVPLENAYIVINLDMLTCFFMNMVDMIKLKNAAIKTIPMALIK